ncbi:MAG: RHS repeat-associated core domain-containing protein, partial [Acidimicrobiales bacterium]
MAVAATDASGAVTSTALTWDGARAVPRLATASTAGADTNLVVGASLAVAVRGGQADPFAADAHGSVLARGEASDLARAEAYDEFGTPVPTSPQGLVDELLGEAGAGASALRFGYRGEVTLDGLAHLRARDYAPRLGRFTTQDPLDGVAGTTTVANPNPYAANDPLNQVDPLGLSPAKDGELRLSAAARARETQQLLAQELRRQGLAYAQLEQANRAARMLPTESLIAWRETARRANSSTSLWSNLTMSDAMGGLRSFGHGLRGGDCSTQASTTMLSCAIGEATFIVEAELTALSIGVRTSKSSAPNTAGLADDVVGPSVRYNRSAHCGGVQTNSPAGRALREGAEGDGLSVVWPVADQRDEHGAGPRAQPIVARALLRRRPRDDRRATPGIRPKRRRLRRDDVLDVPTLAGRIVVAAVSVVHGALGLVMVGAEEVRDAVRRHLEGFWPDHPQEEFSWTLGPIEERLPGFRVRRIAPVKPT